MNNNINFNLYRSFYYVCKYEGFSKASYYANISQSALSTNIKKLEENLNVKLFNRKGPKVELTVTGKELYKKIQNILNILEEGLLDNEVINIGCIRFIADNYLKDTLFYFKKKYPNVKLKFSFSHNTDLFELLKKGELDIVLSRYPSNYIFEDNIVIDKICDAENVFVCSSDYYKTNKNNFNNKDYKYSLILPNSSEKRRKIESVLNEVNYDVSIDIPNSTLLKDLILEGYGIGYINKDFIKKEIDNKSVKVVKIVSKLPVDEVTLLYNKEHVKDITLKFVKIIKESINKNNNDY